MKGAAWKPSPPAEQGRRSVYIFAKRGLLPPLLTTFDLPDTTLPSCQRDVTTVPTQSLALLNNPFVHDQSAALAKRIGTDEERKEQVAHAWRLALGRDPRDAEVTAALAHLAKQADAFAKRPGPGARRARVAVPCAAEHQRVHVRRLRVCESFDRITGLSVQHSSSDFILLTCYPAKLFANRATQSDEPPMKHLFPCGLTRRELVWEMGGGFAGVALAGLLAVGRAARRRRRSRRRSRTSPRRRRAASS